MATRYFNAWPNDSSGLYLPTWDSRHAHAIFSSMERDDKVVIQVADRIPQTQSKYQISKSDEIS